MMFMVSGTRIIRASEPPGNHEEMFRERTIYERNNERIKLLGRSVGFYVRPG
jgi:hypothetical protein